MSIKADVVIDEGDQKTSLNDHIEEMVEYYIICDECRSCTELQPASDGASLYANGWRLKENERGREFVFCPECATAKS